MNRLWMNQFLMSLKATASAGVLVIALGTQFSTLARTETNHEVSEAPETEENTTAVSAPSYTQKVFAYVSAPFFHAFQSVQGKVENLKLADQTREKLLLENSFLRTRLEATQFECRAAKAEIATAEIGKKLKTSTGSNEGRAIASANYKMPTDLLPAQLYTLGVSYFKANESEKAAVIFSMLSGMETKPEEKIEYKTAKSFLLAGVSWYRIQNYSMALEYFGKAIALAGTPDTQSYQVQARLWKAVAAEKMGSHDAAQNYIKDLLDHYPHSTEAAWVNYSAQGSKEEAKRDTASVPNRKK